MLTQLYEMQLTECVELMFAWVHRAQVVIRRQSGEENKLQKKSPLCMRRDEHDVSFD